MHTYILPTPPALSGKFFVQRSFGDYVAEIANGTTVSVGSHRAAAHFDTAEAAGAFAAEAKALVPSWRTHDAYGVREGEIDYDVVRIIGFEEHGLERCEHGTTRRAGRCVSCEAQAANRPAEDLTPEGIQLVIPGVERRPLPTTKQGELF